MANRTNIISNKLLYSLFSVVVIIIILIALFALIYQSENPINPKNNNEQTEIGIAITDFSIDNYWGNPVGMLYDCWFNLTIENRSTVNVTNAELVVRAFLNGSEVNIGNYFIGTYENGTIINPLLAGETKQFQGAMMMVLGREPYIDISSNQTSIVALVMLNNTILDELEYQYTSG